MAYYNNPAFAQGMSDIARAITGDPFARARAEAAAAQAARDTARANLDIQAEDYIDRAVGAARNPSTIGDALAYSLGAGGDQAKYINQIGAAILASPNSGVSPEAQANFSANAGVQAHKNTSFGHGQEMANAIRRQQISSGATIQSARIAAAQRAQAATNKLVEVLGEDGVARLMRSGDAAGQRAVVSLGEAQGGIVSTAAPDILAGNLIPDAVLSIASGDDVRREQIKADTDLQEAAMRGEAMRDVAAIRNNKGSTAPDGSVGLTSNERMLLQNALNGYTAKGVNFDPSMPAAVMAEVARLKPSMGFEAALMSVIGQIEGSGGVDDGWLPFDATPDPYRLSIGDAMTPPLAVDPTQASVNPASGGILDEARSAIAAGANPAQVAARLREMGIDPAGL